MTTTATTTPEIEALSATPAAPAEADSPPAPEQLTLLPTPAVPLQFRLDERTRLSGLQHVAQLRAQMLAQAAARADTSFGSRRTRQARRRPGNQIAA